MSDKAEAPKKRKPDFMIGNETKAGIRQNHLYHIIKRSGNEITVFDGTAKITAPAELFNELNEIYITGMLVNINKEDGK